MKCSIKNIGLIDKYNNCHQIYLQEGLNIITGRSSTGKSALIEIFDYCTGSSWNTIPEGVITDNAYLYFVILEAHEVQLVLARKQEEHSTKVFYKIEDNSFTCENLGKEYFEDSYFVQIQDFKKEIGLFCGLDIANTNEKFDRKKEKGRPSFRNMVTFMLQHQNLIANKHALFYRFDEREKRERVIEEFKIFAGWVDQNYYILCQQLEEKKVLLDQYRKNLDKFNNEKKTKIELLDVLRQNFIDVTGVPLIADNISSEHLLNMPQQYLDIIAKYNITINENSEEYQKRYIELEERKNLLLSNRRGLAIQLRQINSSIEYAKKYSAMMDSYNPIKEAIIDEAECPFCHQANPSTLTEVNKLKTAINWLNEELRKSPKREESFLPQRQKIEKDIADIDKQLAIINTQLSEILKINKQLEENRSLETQALKFKLQIENYLEWALKSSLQFNTTEIDILNAEILKIETELRNKYNVESKKSEAEEFINTTMNQIGSKLDFEKSYKPINLHFDLETFDLYHLSGTKKIYLRSMGSGANWLYSHICLFLAFLKYFASLKDKSKIPTILFIDQPSQVYFPSVLDINEIEFDAVELKKNEHKGEEEAHDDMQAVTNLFTQIAIVIETINETYGYRPQIIISEHADNLHMEGFEFNSFVRARWRKSNEGLIDLEKIKTSEQQTV